MTMLIRAAIPAIALATLLSACGGGSSQSGGSTPTPTGPSSVPTAPGTTNSACSTSVSGNPGSVTSAGGRYTLSVATGSGCAWTAQSDALWASLAPASGVGAGTTVLTVEANTDVTNSRSANLTIGGQVLRFSQANACTYVLEQTTVNVNAGGGTVSIRLDVRDGCAWTARGSETWLSVSPTSGSGGDSIRIEVAENTGDVRHAFVTIANQRVQITQQGR